MLLGVNIDHVATLRNARGGFEPDPILAAQICEQNGADSITAHLREDRRHIRDDDILALSDIVKTRLNLEMAMNTEIRELALKIKPYSICLVPERRLEVTTEGGLDVTGQFAQVREFIKPMLDAGIIVSLFIDPSIAQVRSSVNTGAQFIELHTGCYAADNDIQALKIAAETAQAQGLKVNAGHGLNYENVCRMHEIHGLVELNIGHSIISRAVFVGLGQAVREMKDLCTTK